MSAPVPPAAPVVVVNPRPVEAKVQVSTLVTFLAGLGGALLNTFVANSALLGGLPSWLQFLIIALAPAAATFLAGYAAPHTP